MGHVVLSNHFSARMRGSFVGGGDELCSAQARQARHAQHTNQTTSPDRAEKEMKKYNSRESGQRYFNRVLLSE